MYWICTRYNSDFRKEVKRTLIWKFFNKVSLSESAHNIALDLITWPVAMFLFHSLLYCYKISLTTVHRTIYFDMTTVQASHGSV